MVRLRVDFWLLSPDCSSTSSHRCCTCHQPCYLLVNRMCRAIDAQIRGFACYCALVERIAHD
jgi:hypothetical protein